MNAKLNNAKKLYMHGIRDGHVKDAINKYTGERYTQHSAGVKDGRKEFVEFFEPFIKRNPDRQMEIVRSFSDGQYVFIHAFQSLNNGQHKWVTMDMFDTDLNDRIIEHWDVICAYEEVNHTDMVSGTSKIADLEETENNKRLVTNFLKHTFIEGNLDHLEDFIDENCIQHSPKMQNGIVGWRNYFESGIRYEFVFKVIGEGNFVTALSKSFDEINEFAVFNLFRVESGKIVEHWDCIEVIAPKSEWVNSGKF